MGSLKRRIIEDMEPKEEPPMEVLGWIPVSERLPDKGGPCLVAAHEFPEFLDDPFTDQAHFFDGLFWTGESPAAEYPFTITHWMPLPEPPNCAL